MRYVAIFRTAWLVALVTSPAWTPVPADEFERPPIEYGKAAPGNRVSRLAERIAGGEASLEYREGVGYLPALLAALDVPVDSQMLVFSKTSLQRQRISPRTPRAVYFSDDVYVGFCRSGDVLEISAVDPKLGTVFYTLDQKQAAAPRFVRQTDNCLICHSSSRTEGIPGHLVRSLFVDRSGQPILSAGSHMVDHRTPFEKRWGGWYVTGRHGGQSHLGNLVMPASEVVEPVDNATGQNVTELAGRIAVDKYLAPHSDIVALMVFEHQTWVHNRITKAGFETRQALYYQTGLNKALGEPPTHQLDSTKRRIEGAADDLVEAMLFCEEAKLSASVQGTSGFSSTFPERGPRDRKGRSLREFDLKTRLFKYPCSYLVYTQAFDELPKEVLGPVWQRLWKVLSGEDKSGKFTHLSPADRRAVVEILRETKPGLPDYWKAAP